MESEGAARQATVPRSRSEFFGAVEQRLGDNRELLRQTGKVSAQQLKVFWLEVNSEHSPTPLRVEGWTRLEEGFYLYEEPAAEAPVRIWLDTSNHRIWVLYTFDTRHRADAVIRRDLLKQRGVDRTWLAERFLESVQRKKGYTSRGFRFSFTGSLFKNRGSEDIPRFSGKLWLGNEVTTEQQDFLDSAQSTFSKSSLRMGRPSEIGGTSLLLEVYAHGHMTVTTSEDTDEVLGLVNEIGTAYADDLSELEKRRERFPRPVEYKFGMKLDLERFRAQVESGVGPTKLWLQEYAVENGLHRFTGVDLHTSDRVNLDVAESYGYLVGEAAGCMNAAPRIMTLSAEFLSGKTEMYYDGGQLFA